MRKIQFRAWVTYPAARLTKEGWQEGTCMAQVQSMNLSTGSMRLKSMEEGFAPSNGGSFDIKPPKRGQKKYGEIHEVMQYINLKDREGTDIYEGDLLESGWGILKVMWSGDGFAFYRKSESRNNAWVITTKTQKVKVVGNIYQNPELLK